MRSRVSGEFRQYDRSYTSRGVSVCERWANSFENFLADMGECPSGMTLDRKDNEGNYDPANCRWATRREQMANTRSTHRVIVNGIETSLKDACRKNSVLYDTVIKRVRHGIAPPQAALEMG